MNQEKWRLILGKEAEDVRNDLSEVIELSEEEKVLDKTLESLYGEKGAGTNKGIPNINKWLGDVRKYFSKPAIQVIQKDAFEIFGIEEMLLEPELLDALEKTPELAAMILSFSELIPDKTKETARSVIEKIVKEIEEKLQFKTLQLVQGSLEKKKKTNRPKMNEIDWHKTIRLNLKHYQKEFKSIIPERLIGTKKRGNKLKHISILVDQSGSMSTSTVYAGVLGSIISRLKSIETKLYAFDTNIVDLSEYLSDPVSLLFAAQLGGGTNIGGALEVVKNEIVEPKDTILFLITDLYEGTSEANFRNQVLDLKTLGTRLITLLALDDEGAASFNVQLAKFLGKESFPAFACTPDQFPKLLCTLIEDQDIQEWANKNNVTNKAL